jgi:uncharacterized repeat protein (TIGR01451 family)
MKQKGQTLAEFSLIAPILILTMVLIFQLGRILFAYIAVQNAAVTGARYAVTGQFEERYNGEANADSGWVAGSDDPLEQIAPCWPLFPNDPIAPTDNFVGDYQPYRDARTCSIEEATLNATRFLTLDPQADYWAGDPNGYVLVIYGLSEDATPTDGTYRRPDSSGTWGEYLYEDQYTAAQQGNQRDWAAGFAGQPDDKVAVRLYYNLPVMPLFSEDLVIKLRADTIMTNESFGGTTLQREAILPPEAPPLPELLPPTTDLVVSSMFLDAPPLLAQTTYSMEVTVSNGGTTALDAADVGEVDVTVYASATQIPATTPLAGGDVIGSATLPAREMLGNSRITTNVDVTFPQTGDYYIYVWVDSNDEVDEDATTNDPRLESNNGARLTELYIINAQPADLSIEKTVSDKAPVQNQPITYTLTLTNNGPGDATDIQVRDELPDEVTYLNDDSSGTYDPATGIWSVPRLDNGDTLTLTINARTNLGTLGETIENRAEVFDWNPVTTDTDLTNNAESAISIVEAVNVELTKTLDNNTPLIGDVLTYTLTVTNTSSLDAANVAVEDTLPTGVSFLSATSTTGSCSESSGTVVCAVGNLAPAAGATITLRVEVLNTVPDGSVTNEAIAFVDGSEDLFPLDSRDQVSFSMQAVDLQVTQETSTAFVLPNDTYTYSVTVTNAGPSDADNVTVTHNLPALTTITGSDVTPPDTFNTTTGEWVIASLPAGTSRTLTATVTVNNAPSGTTLTTAVTGATADQREDQPADNTASIDVQVAQLADLDLSSTFSTDVAFEGDIVSYSLTLTNNGPLEATDIVVDVSEIYALRANGDLSWTASAPSGVNQAQQEWRIASLPVGDTVTVVFEDITVEPLNPQRLTTLTAAASVTSLTELDPELDNNLTDTELLVALPVEIIIDNDDPEVSLRGVWIESSPPGGLFYGTDFIYDGQSGKGRKSVTYTIDIPYTYTYEVYMWISTCSSCTTNAPIEITHDGGTDTMSVDQEDDNQAGQWVLLGTYTFTAEDGGLLVILTDGTQGTFVTADAIRIVSQ